MAAWILAKFLFCVFMDRNGVEVYKQVKIEKYETNICYHDQTSLVNKPSISIWRKNPIFYLLMLVLTCYTYTCVASENRA